MRRQAFGIVAVVLLVLVAVVRHGPRGAAAPASPALPPAEEPTPVPPLPTLPRLPERNPFAFVEEVADPRDSQHAGTVSAEAERMPAASGTEIALAPSVRLVGFVRRGGVPLAVLATDDGVLVLGAGQTGGGLDVVQLDEDAGVTIRRPDGEEFSLEIVE